MLLFAGPWLTSRCLFESSLLGHSNTQVVRAPIASKVLGLWHSLTFKEPNVLAAAFRAWQTGCQHPNVQPEPPTQQAALQPTQETRHEQNRIDI